MCSEAPISASGLRIAVAMTTYDSCAMVEYASRRLRFCCLSATTLAAMIVNAAAYSNQSLDGSACRKSMPKI